MSDNTSKVILVVDDDPDSVAFLTACLSRAGYTVLPAASGLEGLLLLRRIKPRLIMLDVQMRQIDGFETCRRIRQRASLNDVPIVFVTACKTAADLKAGLDAGGNDFIVKPFDPQVLLGRVGHWTTHRAPERAAV